MKRKENFLLPIVLSLLIGIIYLYIENKSYSVIYKKEIYVRTNYDEKCEKKELTHDINAVHLSYKQSKHPQKYIDVFYEEEKVGEILIDNKEKTIYYPNIFSKNMHVENLFTINGNNRVFFYIEEYKKIKEDIAFKNDVGIKLKFKNKYEDDFYVGEELFVIDTKKYFSNKIKDKLKLNVNEYKNNIMIESSYYDKYEIMVQFKNGNDLYEQYHFDCNVNGCNGMPKKFEIKNSSDYMGVLIFTRNEKEYTYEYKKEYFNDTYSKYCYQKNKK